MISLSNHQPDVGFVSFCKHPILRDMSSKVSIEINPSPEQNGPNFAYDIFKHIFVWQTSTFD